MNERNLEFSVSIKATPDELWKALTDQSELTRWFAPEIKVVPGSNGSIWSRWCDGVEGEMPVEIWEPARRLRLHWGAQTVDYRIDTSTTGTILRLVHSGFGSGSSVEDEYESTRGGWTTFLKLLQHALEKHPGAAAINVTIARRTTLGAIEAWQRIEGSGELGAGVAIPGLLPGYAVYERPDLNGSDLAIFCEGRNRALVTVMWVLYGLTPENADDIRAHWTGLIEQLLPPRAAVMVN